MNEEKKKLLENPLVREIACELANKVLNVNKPEDFKTLFAVYKEEQLKPEWIITAFKSKQTKKIAKLQSWGKYFNSDDYLEIAIPDGSGSTLEELLKHSDLLEIYSVKRLSDNEEFTIGDEVSIGKIKSIRIIANDELVIDFENGNATTNINHKWLKKVKYSNIIINNKKVLKGTEYWIVNKLSLIKTIEIADNQNNVSLYEYFLEEEKAKEYILMNKVCLSLNDINENLVISNNKEVFIDSTFNKLKELVKLR